MQNIDKDFIELSRQIGDNPLLIQGAGGNSSVKVDKRVMFVKASGKWLNQAGAEDVFVAVDWPKINRQITEDLADPVAGAVISTGSAPLRPSIETTLHSLMPHRFVFHTHSVNTIAHAIQSGCAPVFEAKLAELNWALVPYSKPGLPLTRLVSEALKDGSFDVLIIQNHGLVVGGNTLDETWGLMKEVEARLELPAKTMRDVQTDFLNLTCAGTEYVPADDKLAHQLALDPAALTHASGGSLYPDHVVFLGSAIGVARTKAELDLLCTSPCSTPLHPKAIALENFGVVHRRDLSAGGVEMLKALANVTRRLPAGAIVNYLTSLEEEELTDWDAEKYRQALR